MNIQLPTKKGNPNTDHGIDLKQLVIVGANGSGKTRFGSRIEEMLPNHTHRISAQKSLRLPRTVSPKSLERAKSEFFYGNYTENFNDQQNVRHKLNSRWGGNLNTSLLNDFDKLMILLHTEEWEQALRYKEGLIDKPITKLDKVQKIWELILPHRKLFKTAGTIQTYPIGKEENKYNASEMSDGERVIFYLIAEVICAQQNAIVIIDEPEMHIHKSLVNILFDLIENERPDCLFIYLTHDIDFAFSRQNAVKIWTKSYEDNNVWDYEILDELMPIPEQLYLEVLGSRKPIIFLEGENSSIDYELYQQVFNDHTLKPIGGCAKVIHTVKAFNDQKGFHHIESFGLIDRDRRSDEDVMNLNKNNIWVLDVAEAENLFLIEEVVKAIAGNQGKNEEDVFNQVKDNLITFFNNQLNSQAFLYFKEALKDKFNEITNFISKSIEDSIGELDSNYSKLDKQNLFNTYKKEFETIVADKNYDLVLKVFNLKNALIPNSKVCDLTGIKSPNEYLRLVITLLKKSDAFSETVKDAIKKRIMPFSTSPPLAQGTVRKTK